MRQPTPCVPFELSPELRNDPWLPWLISHAHPDLWAPRVPVAVIERIRRRYTGQRRTTLLNVWIGIRRLLVLYARTGRDDFSVRDIASIANVSRTRLCGETGFLQDLLAVGVIGVVALDAPEVAGVTNASRFQGRTRYSIDMAALEQESLLLVRRMFSSKDSVPLREPDASQPSLLALLHESPDEPAPHTLDVGAAVAPGARALTHDHPATVPGAAQLAAQGAGLVPMGDVMVADVTANGGPTLERVVPFGTMISPPEDVQRSYRAGMVPNGTGPAPHAPNEGPTPGAIRPDLATQATTPVSHGAVGMDGKGMDGKGGGGGERPLSRQETVELIQTAIQQAMRPLRDLAVATHTSGQPDAGTTTSPAERIPDPPPGEPRLTIGLREAWTLYKAAPEPLDLHRLALLPHRFDAPSGGYGAYWLTRAILMLSERPVSLTLPYLRGVLERMQRTGEWSTVQLEARADEPDTPPPGAPPRERSRPVAAAAPPSPRALVAVPAPTAAQGERTALTIFHQYAGGTRLLLEQERQITDRVRDLEIWEVVCANWRANGWKFDSVDNLLDRYCKLEAEHAKDRPAAGDGLSKLEREIYALPGLSDEEKARHCTKLLGFLVEDRKRYVEDLRRRLLGPGERTTHD